MTMNIKFDYSKAEHFITNYTLKAVKDKAALGRNILLGRQGAGCDFLGWIDLPVEYDREEFARIQAAAEKIRSDSEVLIVVGIGGSYLGARAANEFLNHTFYNELPKEQRKGPEIYYAGNSISGTYLKHIVDVIGDRDFSVNVISKSGTTTEPAIAFRVLKNLAEKKYGKEEAAKRIYATTDRSRGALKTLADAEGYQTFVVPDDVGGRFSVLTAVGLLPIAASGVDISELMRGAADMREHCLTAPIDENDSIMYAVCRHIFMGTGKAVEITANYEPSFHYVGEWWKQLFGESEGKDWKGLLPMTMDFSTDLHSLGQFVQDGSRIHFETIIDIQKTKDTVVLTEEENDLDGLNYLAGKDMEFVNRAALNGTLLAHTDGEVPNLMIHVADQTPYTLGQLFYFYEFACGVSGYMLGVNPFNQPGVESYKKNMFALLGKPGNEERRAELLKRL